MEIKKYHNLLNTLQEENQRLRHQCALFESAIEYIKSNVPMKAEGRNRIAKLDKCLAEIRGEPCTASVATEK